MSENNSNIKGSELNAGLNGTEAYADVIAAMFNRLTGTGNEHRTKKQNNIISGEVKMKTIEFEFDSEKDIKIVGKKLIVTSKHFPIKIKASGRDGSEVKRVVSLKIKCGIPRILLS
jgi:hypothetical protein